MYIIHALNDEGIWIDYFICRYMQYVVWSFRLLACKDGTDGCGTASESCFFFLHFFFLQLVNCLRIISIYVTVLLFMRCADTVVNLLL